MVTKIFLTVPLATVLLPVLAAAFVPSYLQADLSMTRSASDVVYEVPFPGWPGGIVPYVLSKRFRASDVQLLHLYMDYIMNSSCVQFVERTNHTAYLHIVTSIDEAGSDFFSFMYTGERSVMIMPPPALPLRGPSVLLLTLGFAPEHTRGDRDEHIYFNCSLCLDNFKMMMQKRYKMSVDLKFPYDGKSMTHIGTDEVKKINAVMWALDRTKTTFNAKQESLSEIDLMKLDFFYNCSVPGDVSGSSSAGDGSSGTGDGPSSSVDSLSGTNGGSSGTGDGLSSTDGGSSGKGDGSFGTDVDPSTEGGTSGRGDGLSSTYGGSLGTGDGSFGTDVGSSTEGGSSGTSNVSLNPDEVVGSSGSATYSASGNSLEGANFRNSSSETTGAGSGTVSGTGSGTASGTGVGVIGTEEEGSSGSSSGGGSGVENLIGGSASSSQAVVGPASILGGKGKVWNGATFVDRNDSVSVVHTTDTPMNFSLMIISPLNTADKLMTSGPMTTVNILLVWTVHLLLKQDVSEAIQASATTMLQLDTSFYVWIKTSYTNVHSIYNLLSQ